VVFWQRRYASPPCRMRILPSESPNRPYTVGFILFWVFMIKRTLAWTRRLILIAAIIVGATMAAALVMGALLAWRLSSGPLRLEQLEPYLLSGLAELAEPYQVSLNSTAMTWSRDRTSIAFEGQQVRIKTREGVTVAVVPEVKVGISIPALLFGRVAPTLIHLSGPQLRAIRTADGDIRLSLVDTGKSTASPAGDILGKWIDALADKPQSSSQFGALRRIEISGARLEVEDYRFGVRWIAPRFDVELRRDRDGIRGNLGLQLDLGRQMSVIKGNLLYERLAGAMRFDLALDHFNPSELAAFSPAFEDLARINLPFSGRLDLRWQRPMGVTDVSFDLAAGEGKFQLVEGQEPLDVVNAQLSGALDRKARTLEISNLFADFGSTRISALAKAHREGNEVVVDAAANVEKLDAATLQRYWPEQVAHGARKWVTRNITQAQVPAANARVSLRLPLGQPEHVKVTALEGQMEINNAEVHYFRPLPPATNAHGLATFNLNVFNVKVDEARVGNLRIAEANVDLLGLHDNSDRADISLTVTGSVADQMMLLDHEPLRYMQRLNIKGNEAGGRATTRARFMFPLFGDLPVELVAISAGANLTDVSIPSIVMGQGLSKGNLTLTLDGGGMKISGTGNIGPAPATFSWQETFVNDVSPATELTFSGDMDEEARKAFRVSWTDVLRDTVGVNGTYRKDRGQPARLEAALDLTKSTLELPWFAWLKPPGQAAQGNVAVTIDRNAVKEVSSFRLSGSGANARGRVNFAEGSQWSKVVLDRISVPGTDLSGSVARLPGGPGFALDFKGASADIRGIYEPREQAAADAASTTDNAAAATRSVLPMDIRFNIKQVTTGAGRTLTNAVGRLVRSNLGWRQIELDGRLENDVPVRLRLVPTATGREMSITTQNAGSMLSTLRLMDNIHGGTLAVVGKGQGAAGPIEATADMRNFLYLQPQTLRRIAEAASPEGADVLARGEGIEFTRLKARFFYNEDSIEVTESRMASNVLGLTMTGRVDLLQSRLDMNGTLVPLYGINSAVGGIPILGWLLTGGEGGGIFAATYSVKGPLTSPSTSVNPLAMLAPGFLRNILFMGGD